MVFIQENTEKFPVPKLNAEFVEKLTLSFVPSNTILPPFALEKVGPFVNVPLFP